MLIQMWLKAPVMEVDKDGAKRNIGGGKRNRKGTPQGGVISPLLSNLFLHLLDRLWEKWGLQQRIGARMVRYADDIVVLCRKGSEQPKAGIAADPFADNHRKKVIQQLLEHANSLNW
jgi:RNA-directed DNA polymerase